MTDDLIRCTKCQNRESAKNTCEACHYSGWMLRDGRPATVKLGETPKWKEKMRREEAKREKEREKLKNSGARRWQDRMGRNSKKKLKKGSKNGRRISPRKRRSKRN